jgi:pimeloyl-ACP methyl ester carboxylesterase
VARAFAGSLTSAANVLPRDARVTILPGEDHLAIMTAPELVAGEVVRFLG